ncbi:hypothetical protein H2200_011538 [Cladophialophora chaetospira]|uniref:Uncharacterized protein n=1 Tax=Cladophialophora chaetospira TaxID=386627 RepID=A0AA38WZH5_9EURO|nr:hypothetical protein H2200_011538 [Cladophialophora chaetospira]
MAHPSRDSTKVNDSPIGSVNGGNRRAVQSLNIIKEDTVNQDRAGLQGDAISPGVICVDLTDDEPEVATPSEIDTTGRETGVAAGENEAAALNTTERPSVSDTIEVIRVKVKVEESDRIPSPEKDNDLGEGPNSRSSPTASFGYSSLLDTEPLSDSVTRPGDSEPRQHGQERTTLLQSFGTRAELSPLKRRFADASISESHLSTMSRIEAGYAAGPQQSKSKRPKTSGEQTAGYPRGSTFDHPQANTVNLPKHKTKKSPNKVKIDQPKSSNSDEWTPMNKRQTLDLLRAYASKFATIAKQEILGHQNPAPEDTLGTQDLAPEDTLGQKSPAQLAKKAMCDKWQAIADEFRKSDPRITTVEQLHRVFQKEINSVVEEPIRNALQLRLNAHISAAAHWWPRLCEDRKLWNFLKREAFLKRVCGEVKAGKFVAAEHKKYLSEPDWLSQETAKTA